MLTAGTYSAKLIWKNIDQDKLIQTLSTKWNTKCCPMCGCNSWSVANKIFELREFNDGNFIIGGHTSIHPVIPIVCDNCGNTIFINPLVAGVIKK